LSTSPEAECSVVPVTRNYKKWKMKKGFDRKLNKCESLYAYKVAAHNQSLVHLSRKVRPRTSAWDNLYVEPTRGNVILPDLPEAECSVVPVTRNIENGKLKWCFCNFHIKLYKIG
jgi:hypothetical protein